MNLDPVVHDFLYLSPFDREAAEEWITGSMSARDRLAATALGPHEYLYIAPDAVPVVDLDELHETGETRINGFHHHYGPQSESQP